MNVGDSVKVKLLGRIEPEYRGRSGTVVDRGPGSVVEVEFEDEAVTHSFNVDDLDLAIG